MPPIFYTIAYGVLVAVSVFLARAVRRQEPLLFGASLFLLASYAYTNIGWWTGHGMGEFREYWAAIDGVCAAAFAMQWLRSRRDWLQIMVALFVVSGMLHAWYGGGQVGHNYKFDLLINVTFLLKNTVVIADALTVLFLARFKWLTH